MRVYRYLLVGLTALTLVACGGGAGTTTAVSAPTTDAEEEPASDPGSVASVDDLPAECVETLRAYLRAIEPVVADVDFQSLTTEDLEALTEDLEEASVEYEEQIADCPEVDQSVDEGFAIIREIAAEEAPGTVAYFDFVAQFAEDFGNVDSASGDCEADIAAFQEFVDSSDSMSELTAAEVTEASSLMSSIAVVCSDERFLEWQEEISDWVSGG